jgi:hypothetical protein
MTPHRYLSLSLLLVLPAVSMAGTPWLATPVTSAYPLQFHVRHPPTAVMIGTPDDLYSRIFGSPRRSFDPRLCDTFDCFDQTADTKVLLRYPEERRIWASATGHDRDAPCAARSDLLSTFERYEGCETFAGPVRRVTVDLQPAEKEVKDESGSKQVDRRPAAGVGLDRASRGTTPRGRTDRR